MRYSFLKKIISIAVLSIFLLQAVSVSISYAIPTGGYVNTSAGDTSVNVSSGFSIGTKDAVGGGGGLSATGKGTFGDTIYNTVIAGILAPLIKLMIALAIVFFLWGVFKFIKEDGDKKEEGRNFMFWGIVGIFVMISVWGLVNILVYTFKLNTTGLQIPNPVI